jgi:hypothetical protein
MVVARTECKWEGALFSTSFRLINCNLGANLETSIPHLYKIFLRICRRLYFCQRTVIEPHVTVLLDVFTILHDMKEPLTSKTVLKILLHAPRLLLDTPRVDTGIFLDQAKNTLCILSHRSLIPALLLGK